MADTFWDRAAETMPRKQLEELQTDRQDELRVAVEATAGAGAEAADRAALEARTREVLHSALGLAVVVEIVAARTLPRSEGKAMRVIDERGK